MLSRLIVCCLAVAAASNGQRLTAVPSTLSFEYEQGSKTAVSAQTIQVNRSDPGAAIPFRVVELPEWVIATPLTGQSGAKISVTVNPGALPPGVYTGRISAGGVGVLQAATVAITLTIKRAPATVTVDNSTIDFTWRTDYEPPAPKKVLLMTDGEAVDYSVASGVPWLTATPASGVISLRTPATLQVSVDPSTVVPGKPVKGVLTIAVPNSATKTLTVNVNLDVQPGPAAVTSVWPSAVAAGTAETPVVIRGLRFYSGLTTVTAANGSSKTTLIPQVIDDTRLMITVPKSLFASAGVVQFSIANPKQTLAAVASLEVIPPTPVITAVVNAASYKYVADVDRQPVAAGSLLSIFGASLGTTKGESALFKEDRISDRLGDVIVEIGEPWQTVPVLFAHASQMTVQLPYDVGQIPRQDMKIRITNKGRTSEPYPLRLIDFDPGIFTADSSGTGQATATIYPRGTVNGLNTPAAVGDIVSLFATGCGPLSKWADIRAAVGRNPADLPWLQLWPAVSVTVDEIPADVLSATAVPGTLPGLVQFNIRIPQGARPGVRPVKLVFANTTSQADVTLVLKDQSVAY